MVLLRAPLGRRGSYLPTGLNILQCLGWSVFELIVIATGASALSKQVLGFGGVAFWKILFGVRRDRARAARPGRLRAPLRPQVRGLGRDRVARSTSAGGRCTASTSSGSGTGRARTRSGRASTSCSRASSRGRRSSPTTRASRARGAAGFWGAGLGYFVPTIPLFALGAVIAMSRHISDAPALLTAIAAGGAASVLALLALTVDESDEAFANVYSGAVSLQNLLPRVPQRLLVARDGGDRDRRRAADRPAQLPAVPLPARLVLRARSSASCSPTGCSPAATTARDDVFARAGAARRARARLARRLLPLPVALPGRARLVDAARRAHPPACAARGAARRCRASSPRSCLAALARALARRPILARA